MLYGGDNTKQASTLFSLWSLRKLEEKKCKTQLVKTTKIVRR